MAKRRSPAPQARTPRQGLPDIYVSAIPGLLLGDQTCLYRAWLPAHFRIARRPNDFDFTKWRTEHTKLLAARVAGLQSDGYRVTLEDENKVKLTGKTAVLSGKPDAIGWSDNLALVGDAKTGKPKDDHKLQVIIYMLVLPMVWQRAFTMLGRVWYADHQVEVTQEEAERYREDLFDLMRKLGSAEQPAPRPSEAQCRYCDLSDDDCTARWKPGDAGEVKSVATTDF